jgi:hypothetical protein
MTDQVNNIRQDPFIRGLLERLPTSDRSSFSDEQLVSLKVALGARTWGVHPVDLRWTIRIWRKCYYFVFLAGANRRPLSRREQELALLAKMLLFAGFITVSALLGILVLYLIKSAAGIDIFPNYSFGVWTWFQEHVFSQF